MNKIIKFLITPSIFFITVTLLWFVAGCSSVVGKNTGELSNETNPLPSWNKSNTKSSIIDFVEAVTNENSEYFIPVADRIATFDNDGTLWSEQPTYFQLFFAMDRIKELAPQHPEWKNEQPFKAVLENDMKALAASGYEGLIKLSKVTHAGMTTNDFKTAVKNWVANTKHPAKNRYYTDFVYQPMLELLDYLRANGFKTYIVSGGTVDFIRAIFTDIYGIPSEQIIGSTIKTKFDFNNGNPVIKRLPELDFIDDKEGKPLNINKIIGKKPIFSVGNSDGDLAMMQWTASNSYKSFMLYVHHTDSVREWAYDRESHIGRLDKGLDEAAEKSWTVIDMKNDWKVIYPFELAE
ncbi:MAG: haloacid dehalogenase-like hydrolase [Bacteroidales bacterium]|nr:haloacid dehalogenase-like hydrolase [Bacteroidales bacterium]